VPHDPDAEGRAFDGNGRAHDELDARVLQDFVLAPGELHLRKTRLEVFHQIRFLRVQPDEFASAAQHGADLAVDVVVVDADDREPNSGLGALHHVAGSWRGDRMSIPDAGGAERRPCG
jgi:hypothetical protein